MNIDLGGQKHKLTLGGKWLIMDIHPNADIVHDVGKKIKFPLKDNSVSNYYSSMTIEHFPPSHLPFIFNEMYRTLRPKGIIRIVVPDFEIGMEWYINTPKKLKQKGVPHKPPYYPPTRLGALMAWGFTDDKIRNNVKFNGHKMMFDTQTLHHYLKSAGFVNARKMKYNGCSKPFYNKDLPRYKDYSLYMEVS